MQRRRECSWAKAGRRNDAGKEKILQSESLQPPGFLYRLRQRPEPEKLQHRRPAFARATQVDIKLGHPIIMLRRVHEHLLHAPALLVLGDFHVSMPRIARFGIETQALVLSYWALKHPAGKPDFHQAESRIVPLA